jgi:asparagine synthase (glutamine-hydrolysing)
VGIRLAVAPKAGFLLSGGMDSSSVLASAVRSSGRKQHAFSSVYEDRTYDESDEIRSMLDSSVEQWHPITIAPTDVFGVIDRMVRAHHEPVATATWLSHFLLCEQAADMGFEVLFGGLGGDELNAGEYEYFFFHFADLRLAGEEEKLRREVASWVQHHDHPVFRKSMSVVDETLGRVVDLAEPGRCHPDRRRLERYADTVRRDYFDVRGFHPEMDRPFRSYLKNRTYQDIFRETAPCCLRAEDRQTTTFGLNHFDPFFDHRLIEFMFRIPGAMKIRDGVTKILLREATRGLLPEATRTRIKKTGWNAPAHVWFSGRNLDSLRDMVGSQAFRERGIYHVAAVRRVIDEHEQILSDPAPRENHMMFLWQLINLELWLRTLDR